MSLAGRDPAPTASRSGHCRNKSSASGKTSRLPALAMRSSRRVRGIGARAGSAEEGSVESHAMSSHTIAADPSAGRDERRAVLPGLLLAVAGSIAFSGKAIIVKLAYRYGVDAVTLIMYRMLFALPMFVLLSWWAGRGKPALERRDVITVVGLGFSGYYLASFLDFAGLQYITASLERLILYMNPTLVLALGFALFNRKVTRAQVMALGVSYAGSPLVFGHDVRLLR